MTVSRWQRHIFHTYVWPDACNINKAVPRIGVRIGNDDAWTTEINEGNYFLETGEQRKMA